MQSRNFSRYSVESSRREARKERWVRCLEWALVVAACAVIVVFAYLLLTGGLA